MNININEYKEYVNNLNPDEIDSLGDDYTSCWLFAYYVHDKYELPIYNYDPVYEITQNINDIKLDEDGIYSYHLSHEIEFHHFVLFVKSNEVVLNSTYGGQDGIISIKYNKEDFIKKFKQLFIDDDKCKIYRELFGIRKLGFKKLDLSGYELSYTYKN